MGHYDKQYENHLERTRPWKETQECDIIKTVKEIKQDMLQLKFDIASLKREIGMLSDNLDYHTEEELYDLRCLEADLQNDQEWLEKQDENK